MVEDNLDRKDLPGAVTEYIDTIIRKMRYRRKVRAEVSQELADHFADALKDCKDEQGRQQLAREMIGEFGDAKLLGILLRRAKKRCRTMRQMITARSLQVIGVLFLFCLLRTGYLMVGRPVIMTDYTKWMNEQVCRGRDESLNARKLYEKASSMMSDELPPLVEEVYKYSKGQTIDDEHWAAIEKLLEKESEAISIFREGTAKPYYWSEYKAPDEYLKKGDFTGGVIASSMPQLTNYKKIARRMGILQITLDIHKGDIEQATDDCIALYNCSQHLSDQGLVIEQLVGSAIEGLAMGKIYDLLGEGGLSGNMITKLLQTVEKAYIENISPMDWSLEKAFWYDMIQRSFTDDGQGGGRALMKGTIIATSDRGDFVRGFFTGFPDRSEVVSMIDKTFEEYAKLCMQTPWHLRNSDELKLEDKLCDVGFMTKISIEGVEKAVEISWRVRAGQAGLVATLGVLRFEKETGWLPESLSELKEKGYLKKIPTDPYSGQPLAYRQTEEGFIIYSVGVNYIDDGGVQSTKPPMWGDDGDAVFWPVE